MDNWKKYQACRSWRTSCLTETKILWMIFWWESWNGLMHGRQDTMAISILTSTQTPQRPTLHASQLLRVHCVVRFNCYNLLIFYWHVACYIISSQGRRERPYSTCSRLHDHTTCWGLCSHGTWFVAGFISRPSWTPCWLNYYFLPPILFVQMIGFFQLTWRNGWSCWIWTLV